MGVIMFFGQSRFAVIAQQCSAGFYYDQPKSFKVDAFLFNNGGNGGKGGSGSAIDGSNGGDTQITINITNNFGETTSCTILANGGVGGKGNLKNAIHAAGGTGSFNSCHQSFTVTVIPGGSGYANTGEGGILNIYIYIYIYICMCLYIN